MSIESCNNELDVKFNDLFDSNITDVYYIGGFLYFYKKQKDKHMFKNAQRWRIGRRHIWLSI